MLQLDSVCSSYHGVIIAVTPTASWIAIILPLPAWKNEEGRMKDSTMRHIEE
jgi:hypothetical protein